MLLDLNLFPFRPLVGDSWAAASLSSQHTCAFGRGVYGSSKSLSIFFIHSVAVHVTDPRTKGAYQCWLLPPCSVCCWLVFAACMGWWVEPCLLALSHLSTVLRQPPGLSFCHPSWKNLCHISECSHFRLHFVNIFLCGSGQRFIDQRNLIFDVNTTAYMSVPPTLRTALCLSHSWFHHGLENE